MTNIANVFSFSPKENDIFLFDTNVLIKLFYPALGAKNSAPYINLFQSIKKVNSTLLISSIQLSEFVNCCIRFQFSIYKDLHPEVSDFKEDYRNTEDYRNSMNAILEIIENDILSNFKRINDDFDSMHIDSLLKYGLSYDFNDAFIAELSRNQNAFLVTDDADYINFLDGLNIITKNKTLLMFQTKK